MTPGRTRPGTVKTWVLSELDFTKVADWLMAHGPAAWGGASAGCWPHRLEPLQRGVSASVPLKPRAEPLGPWQIALQLGTRLLSCAHDGQIFSSFTLTINRLSACSP